MSQEATLGIANADGTISFIAINWNYGVDSLEKFLNDFYSDENKVKQLIALGDIATLGSNVNPDESKEHTFEKPQKNVTVPYMLSDDEEWENCQPSVVLYKDYKKEADSLYCCTINFLYQNNKWEEIF